MGDALDVLEEVGKFGLEANALDHVVGTPLFKRAVLQCLSAETKINKDAFYQSLKDNGFVITKPFTVVLQAGDQFAYGEGKREDFKAFLAGLVKEGSLLPVSQKKLLKYYDSYYHAQELSLFGAKKGKSSKTSTSAMSASKRRKKRRSDPKPSQKKSKKGGRARTRRRRRPKH
jgi:hypothetical protein